MMRLPRFYPLAILFFCLGTSQARALPSLPPLFGDHAVLQGDGPVMIWGTADPHESIVVTYAGVLVRANADASGNWRVRMPGLKAGASGELRVEGSGVCVSKDVVVGDVWLCAGQSNMEWPLAKVKNAEAVIASADFPLIRQFRVTGEKAGVTQGKWQICSPAEARGFTAVGYFFAREMFEKRRRPVGLVNASEGGTPIEAWLRADVLAATDRFKVVQERWRDALAAYPEKKAAYDAQFAAWKRKKTDARERGISFSENEPSPPIGPGHKGEPSSRFNRLVRPLVPLPLRGILWYQGEQNAGRHPEYAALFQALISDWRKLWDDENLPFLYVQLPNVTEAPGRMDWPGLRQAQASAEALPHTAMAVSIDVGDPHSVHPLDKQPIGHRLALLAERHVYGDITVEASGPRLVSATAEDSQVVLRFAMDIPSSRIEVRPVPPNTVGFELCGPDGKFWPATAVLSDEKMVLLRTDRVSRPVAVRYLWRSNPVPMVFDSTGLPSPPFSQQLDAGGAASGLKP